MSAGPDETTSLSRPSLPGRRAELELLSRELALARSGEARFVLLAGDAGVGKTRLMREAARTSEMVALDLHVPAERLGLQDLVDDWLAPLLRGNRRAASEDLTLVAQVYPRLAEMSPLARRVSVESVGSQRVLGAIARLVSHFADIRPVLFLIDDYPRLRPEVRTLVAELALALIGVPVAFLATARLRTGEAVGDRTLSPLLDRHLLRRVEVLPLDRAGMRELIAAELDAGIVPGLVSWLYRKSGGNALFAVELIRTLQGRGVLYVDRESGCWCSTGEPTLPRLPATIANVLESRRHALPPELANGLPILALLGPDAPTALLAKSMGVEPDSLHDILRRLARAGVLERLAKDYAFTHPLMTEHWSRELGAAKRRRLAGQALAAILQGIQCPEGEGRRGIARGSCATGFEAASEGDLGRVWIYADAAGRHAVCALAALELGRRSLEAQRIGEALSWVRRASRRLARVATPAARRWLRAELDYLVGMAYQRQGRLQAAARRLRRFVLTPEALDPQLGIQAFPTLGEVLIRCYQLDDARAVLERGRRRLDRLPDRAAPRVRLVRCEILCSLARIEMGRDHLEAAEGLLEQALTVCGEARGDGENLHLSRGRERVMLERAIILTRRGDFRRAIADSEKLVKLASLDPPRHVLRLQNLALYLALVGDLNQARVVVLEALRRGERYHEHSGEAARWSYLGLIEAFAGNWSAAAAAQLRARELAEQAGAPGIWYLAGGELARARQMLEGDEASDRTWNDTLNGHPVVGPPSRPQLFHLHWARAWILCRRRDWEGALDACGQARANVRLPHPRNQSQIDLMTLEAEAGLLASRTAPGARPEAELTRIAERLATIEAYLREQRLRNDLVHLAWVRLHLVNAGWKGIPPDLILAEIESRLHEVGAPGCLAEVAREFVSTSIASLPRFRSTFAPARSWDHAERPPDARTDSPAMRRSAPTAEIELELSGPRHRPGITTLGRFEVRRAGETKPMTRSDWGSRKARLLLAYFLAKDLGGRGVTRDDLCEGVWPESDSFTLDHTFRVTMSLLRRALQPASAPRGDAPIITYRDGLYRLALDAVWCDAREFQSAVNAAATAERAGDEAEALDRRRRAFYLYRGDFLGDFDEIWIEATRERYRSRFVKIGSSLFAAAVGAGRLSEAQEIGERLVSHDPLSEEGHRLLIRAYLAADQRDAAARQLERCRAILDRDLGIAVSEETVALLATPGASRAVERKPAPRTRPTS